MRRFATVRVRTAAVSMAIVGGALFLGGIALVAMLQRTLTDNVETQAKLRASDVAMELRRGTLSQPLPGSGEEGVAVQVVDAEHGVVTDSGGIRTKGPLLDATPPPRRSVVRTVRHPAVGDGGPYRIVALGASTPTGPVVVYAASSLEVVDEGTHTVRVLLTFGIPILILLVGGTSWWLVGRTLDPVEAIRREVAGISVTALDRRVPEPVVADEIGQLARTMNEMLDRLDASTRRQRAFVSDASHELRSPLSTARAQLEVAIAHPGATDWAAVSGRVVEQLGRLDRLVADLLLLARADEGPLGLRSSIVDLDELVLREVEPVRARGRVAVDLSGVEGGRVLGDPDQLVRVVCNLLDNAERHAATRVAIGLTSRDGIVELMVSDDGPGIADSQRSRVFERFARLDDARSRDRGGAGLGLAIVKEIVSAHDGTVDIVSTPAGARLRVRLPSAVSPGWTRDLDPDRSTPRSH